MLTVYKYGGIVFIVRWTTQRTASKYLKNAPLAQLVEHLTLNQGVQGSSPWRCTESTIFEAERFGDGVFFVLQTMRLDRVVSLKIGHGVIVDHVITSERIYSN